MSVFRTSKGTIGPTGRLSGLALVLCLVACAKSDNPDVSLAWGDPVKAMVGNTAIAFDGDEKLTVGRQVVRARVPATVHVSKGGNWLLNFGDGSGQVFSLELHAGNRVTGDLGLRDQVARRARATGCDLRPDEISLIFVRWIGDTSFEVATENWSRRGECPAVSKAYTVRYDGAELRLG